MALLTTHVRRFLATLKSPIPCLFIVHTSFCFSFSSISLPALYPLLALLSGASGLWVSRVISGVLSPTPCYVALGMGHLRLVSHPGPMSLELAGCLRFAPHSDTLAMVWGRVAQACSLLRQYSTSLGGLSQIWSAHQTVGHRRLALHTGPVVPD